MPKFSWSSSNPDGDLTPVLQASIDAAKLRHPSGKANAIMLSVQDRCDRCGAGAAYRICKAPGGGRRLTLDLCGHDWRRNAADMYAEGWVVIAGNPDELQGVPS
ncbi:DUF7455 domain-containing protein [Streptomyces sp. NPDC001774]